MKVNLVTVLCIQYNTMCIINVCYVAKILVFEGQCIVYSFHCYTDLCNLSAKSQENIQGQQNYITFIFNLWFCLWFQHPIYVMCA